MRTQPTVQNTPDKPVLKTKIPGEEGIWVFVAGDLIVFAVFFILIALGHIQQPEVFAASRQYLDLWTGIVDTLLLLTGSWFVALGVEKCRTGHDSSVSGYFSLALLCAFGFVINKVFEWGDKISAGFNPSTNDFFMYFFVFTGIHLVHVLIGIAVLLVLRATSRKPTINTANIRTCESGAIFWHLVDLLWIALFALFYLL